MKKAIKKLLLSVALVIGFLPSFVFAEESYKFDTYSYNNNYDYVINKYDVNIKVNENNTFDITENITAYFNTEKHGIYRRIPLKNSVKRNDGSTTTNKARVTNLKVSQNYSTSRSSNELTIKVGNADKTLTGSVNYTISYTYNIGKDPLEEKDEFYYNIIGDNWDTTIQNITFKITMPKEFDTSKLGFSSGKVGNTTNQVYYSVNDKTITGEYIGTLNPKEAVTVRLELEEGYFVNAGFPISSATPLMYIVPILLLIISYFIWYKYGKDNPIVQTVEFYPPEGLNSLEVGYLYKGYADSKDVTSLLIYLANKGYIKISEQEEKVLFTTRKGFKITKLKEYDGTNANEHTFFNGLFKSKNEVTSADLEDSFYRTTNSILKNTNSKTNKYKIYEKAASTKKPWLIIFLIITYVLITTIPILSGDMPELIFLPLLFPCISLFVILTFLNGNPPVFVKIFLAIWTMGFAVVPWVESVPLALSESPAYIFGYLVGILCCILIFILYKHIEKHTPYGTQILGKIRGFKTFLETAEKEQLEAMVNQNPSYFYNILPYTYVLGVSKKWISKFETINLKSPDWYDSPSDFDMHSFESFVDSTMHTANDSMTSSPSSSSGSSSSSGGGSSGGGSGGGGGGSW